MENVCVVVGGAGSLGAVTARIMGERGPVVIADADPAGIERAVDALGRDGVRAEGMRCDVTRAEDVAALAEFAAGKGRVRAVVNAAGVSPSAASPGKIMEVNAIGALRINDAFLGVMGEGACLVQVASMAAHLAPAFIFPRRVYRRCRSGEARFRSALARRSSLFPPALRSGLAYCIAKDFVIWLVKKDAARFGEKGARIVSVSPGTFDTPMAAAEAAQGERFVRRSALKRLGTIEEIARAIAACADERMGFLTGADFLVDGGTVASFAKP